MIFAAVVVATRTVNTVAPLGLVVAVYLNGLMLIMLFVMMMYVIELYIIKHIYFFHNKLY